jgi:hypothetical protein
LRRGKASASVSGAMEGGGVAGLAQMRAKLSGKNGVAYERLGLDAAEEGQSTSAGGSRGSGMKRTGSGLVGQGGGSVLDSVRYVEQGGGLTR